MMRSHALFGFSLLLGSLLWVSAGCSGNVCDEALDKAVSCGVQDIELNDSGDACQELAACQADCVNAGSCNDIRELTENQFATNDLAECLFECGE